MKICELRSWWETSVRNYREKTLQISSYVAATLYKGTTFIQHLAQQPGHLCTMAQELCPRHSMGEGKTIANTFLHPIRMASSL